MGSIVSQPQQNVPGAASYHHKTHAQKQYKDSALHQVPPIDSEPTTPQSPNTPTRNYSQTPKYTTEFDFQVEEVTLEEPSAAQHAAPSKLSSHKRRRKSSAAEATDTVTVLAAPSSNPSSLTSSGGANSARLSANVQLLADNPQLVSPTHSAPSNDMAQQFLEPHSPMSPTGEMPSSMNVEKPLASIMPHVAEEAYDVPRNYCQSKVAELLFIAVSANGIKAADFYNGKSDPYARIILSGSKFSAPRQTRTIMRTLHPRWNENFWFHVVTTSDDNLRAPDRILRVELYDYDRVTKDDFLASIEFDLLKFMNENTTSVQELILPFQKGKGRFRCILAWKILPNPSIPVLSNGVNEYYTQSCMEAINEAWNHCVRAEKKKSMWKLHEYSDYVWIVRLEGFQGPQNPMEGAVIYCTLTFKPSFPDSLPVVEFLTNFLHPNIDDERQLVHNFAKLKDSSPKELPYFLDVVARLVEKPNLKIAVNKQLATLYTLKQGYEAEGHRYYERVRGDIEKYAI